MRGKGGWCTVKILVLSDSHASLRYMRAYIDGLHPDHVIHLGDHFDDGTAMAETYPHIRFHQVPGNCDRYRCDPWQADILCYPIGGVKLLMTHGHKHGVKSGTDRLLQDARERGVDAVLYGHTHIADCRRERDLWVLNPGSCASGEGTAGLIVVEGEKISSCRIVRQEELDQ